MVRLVKASRKTHTIQAESWMPTADIQSWGIRPIVVIKVIARA